MKAYDIVLLDEHNKNSLIVFSTNYISPLTEIQKIQEDLKQITSKIDYVYFDFLMCTKNKKERYAKVLFKNDVLNLKTFQYVSIDRDNELRKISANYYKDKLKLVDWTYASSIKRDLINQGFII